MEHSLFGWILHLQKLKPNPAQIWHAKRWGIVHEGRKDYQCDYCSKSFSGSQYLKKHIHTIHDGHKDFKCKSCGKLFSQAGNWETHVNSWKAKKIQMWLL